MRRTAVRAVLGLETSGPVCRIAVRVGDRTVERSAASEFARHSDILFPLLDEVLAAAGTRVDALDGIALSIGPGSFTGLRVGLAAAKVFAAFGGIPLAAVPTLEAMAAEGYEAAPDAPAVVASLDARRDEVYGAVYRRLRGGGLRAVVAPGVMTPAALAARAPRGSLLVGEPPRAATIIRLGAARLAAGQREDPARLVPLYLRRPEAEVRRRAGMLRGPRRR